ncbi:MAG: hypothetical protein QXO71_11520 [Candidatus Jordarchaeaceae archaeon]
MGGAMYTVLRHGGARNHRWRVIFTSIDKDKAEAFFEKVKLKMRQGGLRLVNGEDVLREYQAPLLRTRW